MEGVMLGIVVLFFLAVVVIGDIIVRKHAASLKAYLNQKDVQFKCQRCGNCCRGIGASFWLHGEFSRYPKLQRLAEESKDEHDDGDCSMLIENDAGVTSCRIEVEYSIKAKPDVCREHDGSVRCGESSGSVRKKNIEGSWE